MGKRCCPQVTVQEIETKQLVSTATNSWNTEIERAALETQITPPRATTAAWQRHSARVDGKIAEEQQVLTTMSLLLPAWVTCHR